MPLTVALGSIAVLLSIAFLAVLICRFRSASSVIYAACLAVSLVNLTGAALLLVDQGAPLAARLPIGLPWIGGTC